MTTLAVLHLLLACVRATAPLSGPAVVELTLGSPSPPADVEKAEIHLRLAKIDGATLEKRLEALSLRSSVAVVEHGRLRIRLEGVVSEEALDPVWYRNWIQVRTGDREVYTSAATVVRRGGGLAVRVVLEPRELGERCRPVAPDPSFTLSWDGEKVSTVADESSCDGVLVFPVEMDEVGASILAASVVSGPLIGAAWAPVRVPPDGWSVPQGPTRSPRAVAEHLRSALRDQHDELAACLSRLDGGAGWRARFSVDPTGIELEEIGDPRAPEPVRRCVEWALAAVPGVQMDDAETPRIFETEVRWPQTGSEGPEVRVLPRVWHDVAANPTPAGRVPVSESALRLTVVRRRPWLQTAEAWFDSLGRGLPAQYVSRSVPFGTVAPDTSSIDPSRILHQTAWPLLVFAHRVVIADPEGMPNAAFALYRYSRSPVRWAHVTDDVLLVTFADAPHPDDLMEKRYPHRPEELTGQVHAFDRASGALLWTSEPDSCHAESFIVRGRTIVCGAAGGSPSLRVLDLADGKELQRLPLGSAPRFLSAEGEEIAVLTADEEVLVRLETP